MRHVLLAALLVTAGSAGAQEGVRSSDRLYPQTELADLLVGHAIEFFDGGVSRYRDDGAYSYKYNENDRPYLGRFDIPETSQVCVVFLNGDQRCDTFVEDGARMVLIIADGTRFPIRERRPLVNGN